MISPPRVASERAQVATRGKGIEDRQPLRLVTRIRFQLIGGLVFAVIVPGLARWPAASLVPGSGMVSLQSAMLGSMLALFLGYWALRQMIAYPGVQATQYIAPAFAISYSIIIMMFFFLRIDYSRYQFGASFIVAIVWFYACFFLARRALLQNFALAEVGDTKGLRDLDTVEWFSLQAPAFPDQRLDGIVVDLRADLSDDWNRFLAASALKGIPIYHVKQMAEALTGKVEIEHLSENSLGSVLPSLLYLRLKRLVDLGLAVILAPLFLIIVGLTAIAVKLDSKGPAFFLQPRMGFRGKPFRMIKLRTMKVDAHKTGGNFTEDNDPRITRLGRFLRKYRIDEFPQIINIFAGQMSWIGPRPEALELSDWYQRDIPFYSYRHIVRPGLSGWAQVHQGNVAQVEQATHKLHYDFYYIKHFSPWLDALITAKTIWTVLTGFGSK
ncbi:sugar transferase [Anderseniella sp. Alg231-50]|uniref:sugar transferase n=1 Tax=Anderseniella sp. Alg231-50 TaxID=1922226 RepID=UPI00307B64BF